MGLTAKEVCTRAAAFLNGNYVYWYGGKRQKCTEELLNNLSALYPSIYTAGYKKRCRDDIAAGKYCIDCSGLVCAACGISDISTYAMATDSRFHEYSGTVENGMIVWKWSHCGIYFNGNIIEARGKSYGVRADRQYKKSDWTRVYTVDGIDYGIDDKTPLEYMEAAERAIRGYYGNGEDRTTALKTRGFDAEKVQRIINGAYS